MPFTNIPGMVDFYTQKQARRLPASSPTAPIPGPTGPIPPTPQPQGPASPMGGYIDRRTQMSLGPKAPPVTPWAAYRPTPTSPIAGAPNANPTPSQAVPMTAAPGPVPQVQYTPPTPQTAPAPAAPQPAPQAGQPGSTLQDPGQITAAGRAYADRVTRNLSGENPLVKNAQMTEDTAAARRAYSARKGASEALAQTPFAPGSAQYQRVMTEARAGVDVANQAGQANVNQLARAAGQDALNAANALEDQQYARALGERTNRQQQDAALGQTIEDPKARYAFQRMVASGVSPQDAYRAIVGETGTISVTYRGQSPVQQVQQDATDWVKATQPGLVEGSPEFAAAVAKRMQSVDSAQNAPVSSANREETKESLRAAILAGESLTPEQEAEAIRLRVYEPMTDTTLPSGSDVNDWLKKNPSRMVSIDGKPVKILGGGDYTHERGDVGYSDRHTDFSHVEYDGREYWVDRNGNWFDRDPNEFERKRYLSPERAKEVSVPSPLKKKKSKETA